MQAMVNAVRSTGATNVLMLGGEEYANDLGMLAAACIPRCLSGQVVGPPARTPVKAYPVTVEAGRLWADLP